MNNLKVGLHSLLRKSERFFKTDMVYLAQGGFWLGIGQMVSAIISFTSALFFANFISKDIYGNYKFIIAATSILAAFSLSGMGSVVIQGVAQGFEGILKKAVRSTLRWGSIIVLVAICISTYYFINGNNILGFSMLIAGLSLPFNQAYSLFLSYLSGKKEWKKGTLYNIGSQLINTVGLIVTALLTKNIIMMVLVYFALNTLTTVLAYIYTLKTFHINDSHDDTLIPYGKHLSVMGFFGTAANQFDKVLIFHYLGAFQLAIYAFAQAIPDQFKGILKSIFNIATPKYAELRENDLRKSIYNKFLQLTLATLIGTIALILLMPFIFNLFFPKYLDSVFYSQIYLFGFITVPGIYLFNIYLQITKATKSLYIINIISNTSTILLAIILISSFGLMGAVIENGISWLITFLCYSYYFFTNKKTKQILN